MKKTLTPLLFAVIFLASCKKQEAITPDVTKSLSAPGALLTSSAISPGVVTSLIPKGFVKIQVAKDTVNTDDVVISFNPATKTTFSVMEDARTFQGFGAVSLSSLSSDNVPCAINAMPFPASGYKIPLVVHAKTDGTYKLNITQINAIPKIFDLWLMDNYKKDSLDYKSNSTYKFDLANADTNSYGSQRFSLVIRQNKALAIHFLSFAAAKSIGTTQLTWRTENEEDYTTFTVQRSVDGGVTYTALSSTTSTGLGTYTFTDSTPATGTNQYRVMIKDLNGAVSFTKNLSFSY